MVEPDAIASTEEARQSLARIEERLRRTVADMLEVLRADVPVQVRRAVRAVFERSPQADRLDAGALKALKEDTQRTSQALADELVGRLAAFEAWLLPPGAPLPERPAGLEEHPQVGDALTRVSEGLRALLERHGLTARDAGELPGYRLPSYFVAGHFMKSLVATFWQAVADHRELAAAIEEAEQADQRQARRARWDEA